MKLHIKENCVVCEDANKVWWTMPIPAIRLIGEFTTAEGPWLDDWSIVFAGTPDEWYQIPAEAVDGSFWLELGQALNHNLCPGLASSTTWASGVIYPSEYEGKELFQKSHVTSKPTPLLWRVLGYTAEEYRLEFKEELKTLFN